MYFRLPLLLATSIAAISSMVLSLGANASSPDKIRLSHVPIFHKVAGEIRPIEVRSGDTLIALSARHGVRVENIMRDNGISDPRAIMPGQTLKLDTRRIIPSLTDNGFVADIAAAMIYRFEAGRLSARHPAGFGSPQKPTPTGTFSILFADADPAWDYPSDVVEEKKREGMVAKRRSPPEPPNTLGPFWIQLSTWGVGIHPTPFLSSIGRFVGNTQIKVSEGDSQSIAQSLHPGIRLVAVYQPVRLAITPNGVIWVEAHPDVYGLGMPSVEAVLDALGEDAISVDLQIIEKVLKDQHGIATEAGNIEMAPSTTETTPQRYATWSCLDCPPNENRRVTFRLEALETLTIDAAIPLEVRDESGNIVYRAAPQAKQEIVLKKGASRNIVWELNNTAGSALPPGSYTAHFIFKTAEGEPASLSLPVWLGQ